MAPPAATPAGGARGPSGTERAKRAVRGSWSQPRAPGGLGTRPRGAQQLGAPPTGKEGAGGLGVCSAAGGQPVQRPAASTSSSPCRRRRSRWAAPRSGCGSLAPGLAPQDPRVDRPCRGRRQRGGRERGWAGGTRPAVAGNVWRTRAGGARFSHGAFRHGRAAPSSRTPERAVAAGAGEGGRDGRREQATRASEEEGGGDLGAGPSARRAGCRCSRRKKEKSGEGKKKEKERGFEPRALRRRAREGGGGAEVALKLADP